MSVDSVSSPPLHGTGQVRLLLVDDHPVMRAGVKSLLEAEIDFDVVGEADNGREAVRLAHDLNPDVVIMDVSLPEVGGVEATKLIVADNLQTRVLVLSAHDEPPLARQLMTAGAAGYALKRSACDELVRAVRLVADGGTYVDPTLAASWVTGSSRRSSPTGVPAVNLSEREAEVIRLIARGHTSKQMAESLGLSPRTLETYKVRAMSKLNLRTRADLIRFAMRSGWLRDI